jgi:glyoxylate reductase
MKVYITRNIPEAGPERLRETGWAVDHWASDNVIPRATLLENIHGCDAVLTLLTDKVDAEFLDAAGPNLQVVANLAVGFDNFNVAEMTARHVIGTNTPEVLTDTTADLAFALLMSTARMLPQAQRYVYDGKWTTWGPLLFRGQDIHHATLGLVGMGRIGAAMARRGAGFDMKIIYHDTFRREDLEAQFGYEFRHTVDDVLREADFVSVHTPYMPSTHHLINAERLAIMKRTAILINSARGPIVDPIALFHALRDGTIWAAGLDVTSPEPIPLDDPLLTLDNCLIVPHIASASMRTRDAMSALAADNIIKVLRGNAPPTPVNREAVVARGLA